MRHAARRRKHPHMRGEDFAVTRDKLPALETPPHAWGRPDSPDKIPMSTRNTPTCVGKTHVKHEGPLLVRKHPHMRGEDSLHTTPKNQKYETPPHAWGRRSNTLFCTCCRRNTPTCVGKTAGRQYADRYLRKHPHMRGEDVLGGLPHPLPKETPPHAWGRPVRHVEYAGQPGNTPTCVGKTQPKGATMPRYKKHPHMRGEDSRISEDRYNMVETPPHAWGRQQPAGGLCGRDGNTPTCVGKTTPRRWNGSSR